MDDQWKRVTASIGSGYLNLSRAKLAVVGLGSLGSLTAVLTAMSGVGNFILIDPDILESHNVVRHAADLRHVGMSKVLAVKELIQNRNKEAQILALQSNVFDCIDDLKDVDLVLIAGLGSEIVTTNLALRIRELQKIALYGGVYEKAIAGEVFEVRPNVGPCYSCFASILRSVEPQILDRKVDYGLPQDELKAQPGLGTHIIRVAAVFADWAIRLLVNDPAVLPYFPSNLAILSNEAYNLGNDVSGKPVIMRPSSSKWMAMEKLPHCNVCSSDVSFDSIEDVDDIFGGRIT